MVHRLVQVGTGGRGAYWCNTTLPPLVEAGRIDVVAAVDVNPDALDNARQHLDLPDERCFTDAAAAFDAVEADCCSVVVPPAFHEEVIDAALDHDLDVLTEKPIADTLEASARIVSTVQEADVKCGVMFDHRFRPDVTTLRERLDEVGALDRLVARLLCSYQEYGDWGAFRHDMDNPLLVDGAVHHLDILADLAGAPCEQVYAETWTPEWAPFADDAHATVTMRFDNGVRATYEGALADATHMNCWGDESLRAAGRDGTLIVDQGAVHRRAPDTDGAAASVPIVDRDTFEGVWVLEQFCDWLEGGDPMPTNVRDSLDSMAIVEAAVRSGDSGEPVDPQALITETEPAID